MRLLKRPIAVILAMLILVQATGCSSTQTMTRPWPVAVKPSAPAKKIEVLLVDGRAFKADSGRVAADMLVLYRPQIDTVLVSEVKSIQSSHFSIVKTAGVFFGVFVALVVVAFASCSDTLC